MTNHAEQAEKLEECRKAFEENTRTICAKGGHDPEWELRTKPNGDYAEQRIYAAWCGWHDCWLLHPAAVKLEAVSEKLHNMMLAHLDGVYRFSAREDCDELVTQLIRALLRREGHTPLAKTSWTCPDCCKNPCACVILPEQESKPMSGELRANLAAIIGLDILHAAAAMGIDLRTAHATGLENAEQFALVALKHFDTLTPKGRDDE